MMAQKRTFWSSALVLLLITTACSSFNGGASLSSPDSMYQVDSSFKESYGLLGGLEILGPPISPVFQIGHLRGQYTSNALLVQDTRADGGGSFFLAPLAKEWDIEEPPSPPPPDAGERYINRHTIHEEFYPLYLQLGGARITGLPLTDARYNPTHERLEQYFENVGLYILDSDPKGEPKLMTYGSFHCASQCNFRTNLNTIPQLSTIQQNVSSRRFELIVARLGADFTGQALTGSYQAEDASVEVIYEHLVLYVDPAHPEQTFVRPAMLMLGHPIQEPVLPINDPTMAFVSIDGERGHNVPHVFLDYLARHGGLDVAGLPITEIGLLKEGIYRQCFTNLCLDFHMDPPRPELEIQPASIGNAYKGRYYDPFVEDSFSSTEASGDISMKVWESHPLIDSEQTQQLFVRLSERGRALERWEPALTIVYPDGNSDSRRFPPTNANGISQLDIGPIKATNGTLIPYQVCIETPSAETVCVHEAYIIWGNP